MVVHSRILLLGPTGVEKKSAAARLQAFLEINFARQTRYIDFENQFLKSRIRESASKSWTTFLAQDIPVQSATWRTAWADLAPSLTDEITILGLHATYVSGLLGLRCPIDIPGICHDFKPTLIVTLIDDVFSMWRRTEQRAGGDDWKGRPSLEYLLLARRSEQIFGDLILAHTGNREARHIVCATGNSLHSLANLILFDAAVTYLSFPISAPRKLEKTRDRSFIEVINKAHARAVEEMRSDRQRSFISPLTIDELPLIGKKRDGEEVVFNCDVDRWSVSELWGDESEAIVPSETGPFSIPVKQIATAEGMISTDVGWRDRRLVQQSTSLAIVCPKPPGEDRITRGVNDEIQTAAAVGTVCYLWQKPDWDPNDFVGKVFPVAGSMGISHIQALVKRVESLDELIRAKP